jgi:hypothetical protein
MYIQDKVSWDADVESKLALLKTLAHLYHHPKRISLFQRLMIAGERKWHYIRVMGLGRSV